MNSKNSITSDLLRLLFNLTEKITLNRRHEYIVLSNLSIYYKCKKMI